jgi:guanylate kinase
MIKGSLYIISAASGTGKTSLTEALVNTIDNLKISISYTTRPLRATEIDGKNYFFVTPDKFESLIAKQEFLEYAKVFDYYYGTSTSFVKKQLDAGIDLILEIDWQGARLIKAQLECTSIFLLPPSWLELKTRLEKRKRESEELINKRLATARSEISHYKEFDYIVINDKFESALLDLQQIIKSQRLKLSQQSVKYHSLIAELLSVTI